MWRSNQRTDEVVKSLRSRGFRSHGDSVLRRFLANDLGIMVQSPLAMQSGRGDACEWIENCNGGWCEISVRVSSPFLDLWEDAPSFNQVN